MELPAPALPRLREPQSGWRRAALVAGAVAAVELVVLLVIALAFVARPFTGDAKPRSETPASVTAAEAASSRADAPRKPTVPEVKAATAQLPRTKTTVLVLNGNGIAGAASTAAARVQSHRYPVVGTADAERRGFPRTMVMYRPGFLGEAQRLARDLGLGIARAVPLDGMQPSDLGTAKLVLIVGNDA